MSTNSGTEILAFGNVLLDMSTKIDSPEILEEYNLLLDTQGEIGEKKLEKIAEDIRKRFQVSYNPGGSALNTCRILHKLGFKGALFFGAVGNDESAKKLREMFSKQDVPVRFQVINNVPTGKCICLAFKDKNSLYANIGASKHFSKEFLVESKEINFDKILKSEMKQILYIEGFFIPKRFQVCEFIVERCNLQNKLLAINLSAPYIIKENFKEISFLLNASSFIFGNQMELNTLASLNGCESIEILAKKILSKNNKILVCTNGSHKISVYRNFSSEYKHEDFDVKFVPKEKIIDTTGAGDSFVAGFLKAYLNGKSIENCVADGCDIASLVITQLGCNLP